MIQSFIDLVQHPTAEFRGAPFWAWNSKLEPEELRRQIRLMKEMGLGGFFMHSRVGMNTPYLSDEWFECIRACVDEAKKQGMYAWMYDEDRWPSGAAGGLVTIPHPEFRPHAVRCEVLAECDYTHTDDVAWFAGKVDGTKVSNYRRLQEGEALKDGESFMRFILWEAPSRDWFNGGTYLDTCNPEAVKKFIEVTHEAYAREIPEEFGKTVPGIFSDEPTFGLDQFICNGDMPWTAALAPECSRRFNLDLVGTLPELYFDVDGKTVSRTRLIYYTVLTDLFCSSFAKQIGDWCEEHGIVFTGHVLCEDSLTRQAPRVGACMRFYEYMQAPGMDLLSEFDMVYDTAKQVASVAHQFGRRKRLSETYGVTGWDFPLFGHKALGDWQAACGINIRCQHLAWYSMLGEAKRDYPASIFYQSPWYKYYSTVEDYYARLGAALSVGSEVRDVLVIHPIESTWFGRSLALMNEEACEPEDRILTSVRSALLKENIDFDYGDEDIMARHGKVEGEELAVNLARYKVVVIPQLRTIRESTLTLLHQFAAHGGKVVYLGNPPAYVDGLETSEALEVFREFASVTLETLVAYIADAGRRVSISDGGGEIDPVLYSMHSSEEQDTLFVCNLGCNVDRPLIGGPRVRERTMAFPEATISWKQEAPRNVYELDLCTGKIYRVASEYQDGALVFGTSFVALESHFFFATDEEIPSAEEKTSVSYGESRVLRLNNMAISTDEPNVLVLDNPSYSIDGGAFSVPTNILVLDDYLRKEVLGKGPRGESMVQPWCREQKAPERTLDLRLKYKMTLEAIPSRACLAIEQPELYTFKLNGQDVALTENGTWCDKSMKTLALPVDKLVIGTNTLEVRCAAYHEQLAGLEICYILGDFGVYATYSWEGDYTGDVLRKKPEALSMGNWCEQGFRYYSGNLTYTQVFTAPEGAQNVAIAINEWRGAGLLLQVNDGPVVPLLWPPFEADVTPWLKPGENTLKITVLGHRRNSHGQLHSKRMWTRWNGSGELKSYQVVEPQVVPCGILAPLTLKFS